MEGLAKERMPVNKNEIKRQLQLVRVQKEEWVCEMAFIMTCGMA